MNGPLVVKFPTLPEILIGIRAAEDAHRKDLTLKLHSDGSGRILDNRNDEELFVFDNAGELDAWLLQQTPAMPAPRPIETLPPLTNRRRGTSRYHISDECLTGIHRLCRPGETCNCRCHGKPGEAA